MLANHVTCSLRWRAPPYLNNRLRRSGARKQERPCHNQLLVVRSLSIDFRGRSSGSRIVLLAAPSRLPFGPAVASAAFVPGYSGGSATDLHRFPYSFRSATSRRNTSRRGGNLTQPRVSSSGKPVYGRG